jgi:hypothetical protein
MPFRDLRKQWEEISLERKLAMFVAPLFVAVASGVLIPLLTGAFRGEDGTERPSTTSKAEGLEVIDLAIGTAPPLIDLTVRNTGELTSVIRGANLRIRDFSLISICPGYGSGGLPPSYKYDVKLPPNPLKGDVVSARVSQQVPA